MLKEQEFKDFYKWARVIAVGGSIGLIAWCSFAHGYVYDVHLPSSEEIALERAFEDKVAQEAQWKLDTGEGLSLYEIKCLNEYYYRNGEYQYLDREARNDYSCRDRLTEGREGNEPAGSGTYDRDH